MKKSIIPAICVAVLFFCCNSFSNKKEAVKKEADKPASTKKVLLELFTSQGCSSCPPADKLLKQLSADTNLVALAFHVDYWNRLGWKDPFSDARFSQRQSAYSNYFKSESVYTPQLVVDGKFETVGSNEASIRRFIDSRQQANAVITISIDDTQENNHQISVSFHADGPTKSYTFYGALVQKTATTHIKAGENTGVALENTNIVRSLASTDNASGKLLLPIPEGLSGKDCRLVVFGQNKDSGIIEGVETKFL